MPKLTNKLPSYRLHKRSGQAIVNLSGKDFYLGPHGTKTSKHEYDRLIAEWLANGRSLLAEGQANATTISDLCADYWRFCKTYYIKNGKPTDEQAGVRAALRQLRKQYGSSLAVDFGPLALEGVRDKMVSRSTALVFPFLRPATVWRR